MGCLEEHLIKPEVLSDYFEGLRSRTGNLERIKDVIHKMTDEEDEEMKTISRDVAGRDSHKGYILLLQLILFVGRLIGKIDIYYKMIETLENKVTAQE